MKFIKSLLAAWLLATPAVAQQLPSPSYHNVTADSLSLPNGAIGTSMLASGAAASNLGFTPARVINVMDAAYGAKGDGTTDDTAAFTAAITVVNASATLLGQSACLTIPKGVFYINGATLPSFTAQTAGGVCGAGSWKSIIKLGTSYAGDLFSWSDAWMAGVYNGGNSSIVLPQKLGPRVTGLTILADNTAAAQQNAFMFYDHNDFVFMDDVDVHNLHGRALAGGILKNDQSAYIRESHFSNLRVFNSGATGVPAVEFTAQCGTPCTDFAGTDELDIADVDIYGPRGPGLAIRNASASEAVNQIRMARVRIEGTENNTFGVTADLMMIGDGSMAGAVSSIHCRDCELVSPYTGYAALNINGGSGAAAPSLIEFAGQIVAGSGGGAGVQINAGSFIAIDLTWLASVQTNVTVASSATTSGPIIIDGNGHESAWTWNVDASALPYVCNRRGLCGSLQATSANQFLTAHRSDGAVGGGNARGMGSVDWQTQRFGADQVASGQNATISGGNANRAAGAESAVAGGYNNVSVGYRSAIGGGGGNLAGGFYTAVPGGINANTWNNYGVMAFASGQFASAGDAQLYWGVQRATTSSTTAARLTADGGAASAANIWNLPDNYAITLDLTCTYRDVTNAKAQSWKWLGVLMVRGTGAATTAVAAPAATNGQNIGAPGATAPTLSADTTNGGLNITFTAPNSNAAHIVCGMSGVVSG